MRGGERQRVSETELRGDGGGRDREVMGEGETESL